MAETANPQFIKCSGCGLELSVGHKCDLGKPQMGLLPHVALVEIAKVMTFGCKKYSAHNWRIGMDWSRCIDAAYRHLGAFNEGEDCDGESGELHLAHLGCCVLFLLTYQVLGLGTDDRYKPEKKSA